MSPAEIGTAVSYLSGELPGGRIGLGHAAVYGSDVDPAPSPTLTVAEVDTALRAIGATSGPGSQQRRRETLSSVMGRATQNEQEFLRALLLRELRQGAFENSMSEAIAEVIGADAGFVLRAVILSGNLADVAVAALTEGTAGLSRFRLTLFRPVRPMLARTAGSVAEALDRHRPASIEVKLDGARVQVHRDGRRIEVYTRSLRDVTAYLPEVVAAARELGPESLILDGEVIALAADGHPEPFQVTMTRFGRKLDIGVMRESVPLTPFFFDCLHIDGTDLIDATALERWKALEGIIASKHLPRRIVTADTDVARTFYDTVLGSGHEGVMVKSLDAPYQAGRRGSGWLKVKPAHTLDLVVLAVEWGSGRRSGWLSNLHLGARDPESGEFVMLGKTFKGMTDEMLAWQTNRFLALETTRDGNVVHVRPEQVVEVAFDGIQASSRYPGGLSLRFARVKGYRDDKGPDQADTIKMVRNIYDGKTP